VTPALSDPDRLRCRLRSRSLYAKLLSSHAELLVSALALELVEASIVARCAVMVRAAFRAVMTPVVPSPVMAVLPVDVAIPVGELPCVMLLRPSALVSLVVVV